MKAIRLIIFLLCCGCSLYSFSQDTIIRKSTTDPVKINIDTAKIKHHDPRIATRRSAFLPGLGQIYNREYWKVPIVWGALGTAAGFWIYNNNWYKRTKLAFEIVYDTNTARYGEINPRLFSTTTGKPFDASYLQQLRNDFRRNRDYSLLYFLGLWALNIADATVFAHLKEFDVSNDLSLKLTPQVNPLTRSAGFSLALSAKDRNSKKKIFLGAR
jgi:hypothetical protein